ncbi:MAG TPA: ABC transporter ATP-binding protein [Tepidisphaeraceae bacterium]|nr:ABC transporter ATP-binding protein [Tepidisphaeraceae bacterium]
MASSIEVQNVTKRYGSLTAVDDVSFTVQSGETFGMLGPNGAGKTTTLEMIEGLRRPTSGRILVEGIDVAQRPDEVKAIIGVQLQSSMFFDNLNLVELIETFASCYDRRVDAMQLLADVQLTEKAGSLAKELSGGQKQRLSIAIGLVNDPKVIFLDEPTTGLDPQARHNLWGLVKQIKSRGKTVVLTTHYMEEAEVLCDRIAIMDHAKIVALNTTEALLAGTGIDSRIEFSAKTELRDEAFAKLAGVSKLERNNGSYCAISSDSQATLDELFALGRSGTLQIQSLSVRRATLEDVFLKLTGHQLRE